MCEFCEPSMLFGNGVELNKEIVRESIDFGECMNFASMAVWLWSDEDGGDTSLQILLDNDQCITPISTIDISINYCPKCGRKLR